MTGALRLRWNVAIFIVLTLGCQPDSDALGPASRPEPVEERWDRPEAIQVSSSGAGAYEAALTSYRGGFAVAWHDSRSGNSDIYFRVLDEAGRATGPEQRVTDEESLAYEVDIQAAANALALAWYERDGDSYAAMLASYDAGGQERWRRRLSPATRNGRIPMMRTRFGNVYVAWLEDTGGEFWEVRGGWWDAAGSPFGEPHTLASAGETTWNINGRLAPDGSIWIVFDTDVYTRAEELYLVRVGPDGVPLGDAVRLTDDDGFASKYPDIAFTRNLVALTWFDQKDGNEEVYVYIGPQGPMAELVPTSYFAVDGPAIRITNTPGESIGAYVEWNDLRLGVAWNDNTGGQHELYYQSFDPAGDPVEPVRRITETATESVIPAIGISGNGFAMSWNEYAPPPDGDHNSPDARSEVYFARVP